MLCWVPQTLKQVELDICIQCDSIRLEQFLEDVVSVRLNKTSRGDVVLYSLSMIFSILSMIFSILSIIFSILFYDI